MRFAIIEAEQRTELWFAARAGRVTGSKADAKLYRKHVASHLAGEWSALKAACAKAQP